MRCVVLFVFRLAFFCFRLRKHDFQANTHTLTHWHTSNHLNYCQFECDSIDCEVRARPSEFLAHRIAHSQYKLLLSKQNLLCVLHFHFILALLLLEFWGWEFGLLSFLLLLLLLAEFGLVRFGISFERPARAFDYVKTFSVKEDNMTVSQEQHCCWRQTQYYGLHNNIENASKNISEEKSRTKFISDCCFFMWQILSISFTLARLRLLHCVPHQNAKCARKGWSQ